jgi:hypothetical protein
MPKNKVTDYLQVVHGKFTAPWEDSAVTAFNKVPMKSGFLGLNLGNLSQTFLAMSQNCIDC